MAGTVLDALELTRESSWMNLVKVKRRRAGQEGTFIPILPIRDLS